MHCSDPACTTCYTVKTFSGVAMRRGDTLVEDYPRAPPRGQVLELAAKYVRDLGSSDEVRRELAEICATHALNRWLERSLMPG